MDIPASPEGDSIRLPDYVTEVPVNFIPALSTYARLLEGVELSLSSGGQVSEDVFLVRDDGKYRLYAIGEHDYQRIISKEEQGQSHLLINGESTVEVDYSSMHANLLLNREGLPSEKAFYERLLKALGIAPSKKSRSRLKLFFTISLDRKSFDRFNEAANRSIYEETGERPIDLLGVTPEQIYRAIVDTYPPLAPYICTGEHREWLEHEESEIMIDVLETLAKMGVVGLPLHDSVIAVAKYAHIVKLVMSACYKKKTGFEPYVKLCLPCRAPEADTESGHRRY